MLVQSLFNKNGAHVYIYYNIDAIYYIFAHYDDISIFRPILWILYTYLQTIFIFTYLKIVSLNNSFTSIFNVVKSLRFQLFS